MPHDPLPEPDMRDIDPRTAVDVLRLYARTPEQSAALDAFMAEIARREAAELLAREAAFADTQPADGV